jgi:hypothetical protein
MSKRKRGRVIGFDEREDRYSVLCDHGHIYQSQITYGFTIGQDVDYTGPDDNKVFIYEI